jgi:hypothetical protein
MALLFKQDQLKPGGVWLAVALLAAIPGILLYIALAGCTCEEEEK